MLTSAGDGAAEALDGEHDSVVVEAAYLQRLSGRRGADRSPSDRSGLVLAEELHGVVAAGRNVYAAYCVGRAGREACLSACRQGDIIRTRNNLSIISTVTAGISGTRGCGKRIRDIPPIYLLNCH